MLAYKNLADSDSMYKCVFVFITSCFHLIKLCCHSTPPTFTIYLCSLVLSSLLTNPPFPLALATSPPLSPLAELADKKSSQIYALLSSPSDGEDKFYQGTAETASRSRMNVTFRIKGGESVEKLFVKKAAEKGIVGVAGHRSVGGAFFFVSFLSAHLAPLSFSAAFPRCLGTLGLTLFLGEQESELLSTTPSRFRKSRPSSSS